MVPLPSALSSRTAPPLCFTMPRTVESPRPEPCPGPFVVKNGSNARPLHLRRHPDPGVPHGDGRVGPGRQVGVRARLRLPDLDGRRLHAEPPARRHRVARVDGEVDDHLLELAPVDPDPEPARGVPRDEPDILSDEPPQHPSELVHDLGQVEDLGTEQLLPAVREELPREPGPAPGGALDLAGVVVHRIGGRRGGADLLGVAEDHREEVVEVVGDPAGELSHGLHLLRLAELLLERLPRGDVGDHAVLVRESSLLASEPP